MLTHFLSLDVEDWFHILDYEAPPEMRNWEALESRVELTTRMVLDLFDRAQVKCTCFVLGWIAEQYPHLIQEIAMRGHEIATHGHRHLLVYENSPKEFELDLLQSVEAIENACGIRPRGFRAPGFSIKNGTLWALDVLAQNGFRYDASLFTAVRGHGGIRLNLRRPAMLRTPGGHLLAEFPTAPHYVLGTLPIPFAGGGYFRFFPVQWIEHCIRRRAKQGCATTVYCHPRDFDPEQPRMPGLPWERHFKCYVGLASMSGKVERLLKTFAFGPIADHLPVLEKEEPMVLAG